MLYPVLVCFAIARLDAIVFINDIHTAFPKRDMFL